MINMANHEFFTLSGITCYLDKKEAKEHLADLEKIKTIVSSRLSSNPNFDGIKLTDLGNGGITLSFMHKQIKGYVFCHGTIDYDWSNVVKVTGDLCDEFIRLDSPDYIKSYRSFLGM